VLSQAALVLSLVAACFFWFIRNFYGHPLIFASEVTLRQAQGERIFVKIYGKTVRPE
jgi:hypothetical protein